MDTSSVPISVPTEQELRTTLAPVLGIPQDAIEPDASLVVLGLSSLEIMRLVSRWRKQRIPVEFEALVASPTLAGWLTHFESLARPAPNEPAPNEPVPNEPGAAS
ncbi:phosphopantetheine-binding protein [Streptomyces sp. NPDC002328]|uniref:phosphopantetheine-binding protein n=1 Tax=Streptomyces sp. NPDC002328 TaxID=3364642 RepID=UPI00369F9793